MYVYLCKHIYILGTLIPYTTSTKGNICDDKLLLHKRYITLSRAT